jgi:hypothetical protein
MAFFSDAVSFPEEVRVQVDPKTGLGLPTNTPVEETIDRTLLVDVVMTPESVKAFQQILTSNLNLSPSELPRSNA